MIEASTTPQALKAMDAQTGRRPRPIWRPPVPCGRCSRDGTSWWRACGRRCEKLIVALNFGPGEILIGVVLRKRPGAEQPTRQFHMPATTTRRSSFFDQIIGLDDRRARTDRPNGCGHSRGSRGAAATRRSSCRARLRAGPARPPCSSRAVKVSCRSELFGGLAGMPEAIDHGRRQRQQAAALSSPISTPSTHRLNPRLSSLMVLMFLTAPRPNAARNDPASLRRRPAAA